MQKHRLRFPAGLLALTILVAAGALPVTAWAQPAKPKPAASATAGNDTADEAGDSAGTGKKVKTEAEKAEGGKTRPKPATDNDEEKPSSSPSTTPVRPGPPAPPPTSPPPRDR